MNELQHETSPYLLQHAHNPIHWKAWNDASLQLARTENKLLIVSIGYSACHWCHVMEHESFEDEEVAAVMNSGFVSIKVDREERPDVDAIYMKAVQLMTRQGGWPLNVVCLPDGRPVWGGTYFKKDQWTDILQQLQNLYVENPEKMLDYAEKLHQGITVLGVVEKNTSDESRHTDRIKPLVEKWSKSFDWDFGGYARAPKFMMPNNYLFLQRYGYQTQSKELLDFVDLTLTRMAYGGLFDTVDGGFSRYSVDLRWHVPHFEKMLYDNGQLVSLYAEAYKRTKNPLYKEVVEKTLAFVERELLQEDHAFYSALDADSINETGTLEEGAFYVWKKEQLQQILKEDFEIFAELFNINDFGYWEHDHYVLIQSQTTAAIASQFGLTETELRQKKKDWEQLLYNERKKRPKPRLDDKSLTSWNALMLKGYTDAYKALGNESYLAVAEKNAQFLITRQWSEEGLLWHSYKNGKSTIPGFLEDYAFVIEAFLSLYQATLVETYLHQAKQLTDYTLEHFYDEAKQFFAFNARNSTQLIAQHFETEDNVIPASNSVMANNLYTLGLLFHNSYYEKVAVQMLHHVIPYMDYASAFSNWLNLWLNLSDDQKELAVCGKEALANIKTLNAEYLPNVILAGTTTASNLPFLHNRFDEAKQLFYICQHKNCLLPNESLQQTVSELKIQ
ncbi:thioredoxin domain-containing protein [Flavobacterium suncheonense]|uniref:Thioredoxin n=1 Tax=Flavobacterium suncheonense GH29-5 = DSM 17707 TaxID=1121899 RepID=A0A0A2MB02_9FLAO|nr:thioredoxin domain-containing protein [Flavobacterium suncheonense]KGO89847.1 thioredoxin [Flavobacterium suncheonense GH29-5 = DSM 17707]